MTLGNFMGTNILNLSYMECWLLAAGQANPSPRNDGYTFGAAGSGHVDLGPLAMHLDQLVGSYGTVVNVMVG